MMENQDRLFDQQVHGAYERIVMSDEAQERVLANLLAAQARRSGGDVVRMTLDEAAAAAEGSAETEPHDTRERPRGEVVALPARRRWMRWLPLAAAVVAALVVVRLAVTPAPLSSNGAAEKTVSYDAGAMGEDMASEEKAMDSADEAAAAPMESLADDEATAVTEALGTVDYYPLVTLEDGTLLTALVDGLYTVPVEEGRVGELVGEATARPTDGFETVPCTVYRLVDDDHGYAVRYGDEQTYWFCAEPDLG